MSEIKNEFILFVCVNFKLNKELSFYLINCSTLRATVHIVNHLKLGSITNFTRGFHFNKVFLNKIKKYS